MIRLKKKTIKLDCFLDAYTTYCYALTTFTAFFFSYPFFFALSAFMWIVIISNMLDTFWKKNCWYRASCFILQIEKIIKHFDYNKSERFTRYLFTCLSFLTILLVTRYSLLFPHYPALFIFTSYFSIVSRYFLLVTCYFLLAILQNLLFTSICFETNNETRKT